MKIAAAPRLKTQYSMLITTDFVIQRDQKQCFISADIMNSLNTLFSIFHDIGYQGIRKVENLI